MKYMLCFYYFLLSFNGILLCWSGLSFNTFRIEYTYNNLIINNLHSKNIIFEALLIFLNSMLSLFSNTIIFHFVSSTVLLILNIIAIYYCDTSCQNIFNLDTFGNINILVNVSIIIQSYNILYYLFYLYFNKKKNQLQYSILTQDEEP